jgi:hypothetical protein
MALHAFAFAFAFAFFVVIPEGDLLLLLPFPCLCSYPCFLGCHPEICCRLSTHSSYLIAKNGSFPITHAPATMME